MVRRIWERRTLGLEAMAAAWAVTSASLVADAVFKVVSLVVVFDCFEMLDFIMTEPQVCPKEN